MKAAKKPSVKKPARKIPVNIRLSDEQLHRLDLLVEKEGATRGAHIQLAVSEYLKNKGV